MKQKFCLVGLFLCAALVCPLTVSAAQTVDSPWEQNGGEAVYDALPEETKELLDRLGVEAEDPDGIGTVSPQSVWDLLRDVTKSESGAPLASFTVVVGIMLMTALLDGMRHTLSEPTLSGVYQAVTAAGTGVALMVPLSDVMARVGAAADSVSVFMGSFVPVYAGVMAAGGSVTAALSYQTMMLFAAEMITFLITRLIVPLMAVSLAFGFSGAAGSHGRLGAVGGWLQRSCGWGLGTAGSLFTGILSFQQLVTGSADSLSARAVKLSLSSFVPLVGGTLSEGLSTLQGSLLLLRSTAGVFGVAATALIVLPPLISCVLWCVGLSVCRTVAQMLSLDGLAALFQTVSGAIKVLVGALFVCGMVMIISAAVVMLAGKGA